MNRKTFASLLPVLLLAACAPNAFRIDAAAMWPQLKGGTALQNSSNSNSLADVQNNLRGSLDIGQEQVQPYVRAEADWGNQRVRVHGFRYEESGSGPLNKDFGDLPAGTIATTNLEYTSLAGAWSIDLMPSKTLRLGPGAQLGIYSLDMTARSTSPAGFETVKADFVVPELFVDGGVDLGLVSLDANVGYMTLNVGDANGHYVDGELLLRLHPSKQFEAFVGYRFTVVNSLSNAQGRDFDANFSVTGLMIGGGIVF